MKYLIIIALFLLQIDNVFANEELRESLRNCYMQYAKQREVEDGTAISLWFKAKARSVDDETPAIPPENPVNLGIDIDEGLEWMLTSYNKLMQLLSDERYLAKDANMLGYMQCLHDIMVVEDKQTVLGEQHANEAKWLLFYNLKRYDPNITTAENKDQEFQVFVEHEIRNAKCSSIFFTKGNFTPNMESKQVIERIIKHTGTIKNYNIVIIGYVDWRDEPHYAKMLTKKRMMFVRDVFKNSGILNEKLKGLIKEIPTDSSVDIDKARRIKLCIIDSTVTKIGRNFIPEFDYSQKGEKMYRVRKNKK